MKICEFTFFELEARFAPRKETGQIIVPQTPMERAMLILTGALEAVNQAGLDGKKLSDLRIIHRRDNARLHLDDGIIEIHAKVTHRLKT